MACYYQIEYSEHKDPTKSIMAEKCVSLEAAKERAIYLVVRGIAAANSIKIYVVTTVEVYSVKCLDRPGLGKGRLAFLSST